jgi:hypothetical protein
MDKQGANIDLLFRNGLKDYEVLPPKDTWTNLRSLIARRRPFVVILRAAATIAVLLSISILAYRYGLQISSLSENNATGNNELSVFPGETTPGIVRTQSGQTVNGIPLIASADDRQDDMRNAIVTDAGITSIENILYPDLSEVNTKEISYEPGERIPPLDQTRIRTFDFNDNSDLALYENPVRTDGPRWSVAALASPAYYSRIISGNADIATSMTSGQQPAFAYTGGVAVSYKVNKRFSVQSGLYYSSVGQELSGISAFGGFSQYDYSKGDRNFTLRTANGMVYTNNPDVFLRDNAAGNRIITMYTNDIFDPAKANLKYLDNSLRQNFGYLEVPVILRYKVIDKSVDLNIIGGVSSNVLVANSVYASIDGQKYEVGKTEGLNMISFSSSFGMGMEYNFSGNFSLNLEPTLKYYINPFSPVSGIKIHPYSFGLLSGLTYKF